MNRKMIPLWVLATFFLACTASLTSPARAASGELKIAVVQYSLQGGQTLDKLVQKLEAYAQKAHAQHAGLLMLPELAILDAWPIGKGNTSKKSESEVIREIARQITPPYLAAAQRLARKYKLAILAGSVPELRDGKLLNTAVLFLPDGSSVRQAKLFPTPWEVKLGFVGADILHVYDLPWGRTTILICYDSEHPAASQALVDAEPELILVPSMTEDDFGLRRVRRSSMARAIEHHAYVVVTGTVGQTSKDWHNAGQAVFLTPRDRGFPSFLAMGTKNEDALVMGKFDFKQLRESRKAAGLYPARSQRNRTIRLSFEKN